MWKGSWRFGRESKSSRDKKEVKGSPSSKGGGDDSPNIETTTTTRTSDNGTQNQNSGNVNSVIHGDTLTQISVSLNFPVMSGMHPAGESARVDGQAMRTLGTSSPHVFQDSRIPSMPSLGGKSAVTDISSTRLQHDAFVGQGISPTPLSPESSQKTTEIASERPNALNHTLQSEVLSNTNLSIFSGANYPSPKAISTNEVKKHIPKHAAKHIQTYMSAELFGSKRIIPLWSPSPSIRADPQTWRRHTYIGDVGIFNDQGGFDTLFNLFCSKEKNLEMKYNPPDDFVPYGVNLEDLPLVFQDINLSGSRSIKKQGFKQENMIRPRQSPINSSHQVDSHQFSLLYLPSYLSVNLDQWERAKVLEYIRGHQEAWQKHVENTTATQLSDRPLVVIFYVVRTKSCALAAGNSPNILKTWKPKVTLVEILDGARRSHHWEADVDNVYTTIAPSRSFLDSLESHFKDMDMGGVTEKSSRARKEMEECHCVAVGVYGLQKKKWIQGGSVTTRGSGWTLERPNQLARMSLPARLNPSIRETIGF